MNVKYVHKVPLITGFCYSESLIVCLMFVFVFLGKIPGKCLSAQNRCILEVFSVNRKVNRDFHICGIKYCPKMSETVPNPGKFVGEPPHQAAQPPHAVAIHILHLHYIFPCLFYNLIISFNFFCYFILFYNYLF